MDDVMSAEVAVLQYEVISTSFYLFLATVKVLTTLYVVMSNTTSDRSPMLSVRLSM